MTSLWKQFVICAVLIGAAGLAWQNRVDLSAVLGVSAAPAEQRGRERSDGIPVIVAATELTQDDRTLSAIGTGFAARSVTLRAPSDGEITELNIAPGRRFAQGDTLVALEDSDERFAVSLAEARFTRARDELDRIRRLQDSGVAAAARLEQVMSDFAVAEIELDRAREALANRVLRAPFDGITGLALVEVGDRISANDPIGSYDDRSSILLEFDVPEALLGRVTIGLGVTARTPSVEARSFAGQISAINSRIDATTRTARVRAMIDNSEDLLRPGASFTLDLDLPGSTFPAVPELALQFSEGALHVWRVRDGAAERVAVTLVRRRAGLVIVDGPLADGDLVVVEGTQRLRNGRAVSVLNDPAEANS
jgi:RND family efflux transporter MFP subunit